MLALLLAHLACAGRLSRRAVCGHGAAAAVVSHLPAKAALAAGGASRVLSPSYVWQTVPGIGTPGRSYALVTFTNGVRGLVASDDTQTRVELAACVGCGSLDDPPDFEGLAHLAEHVTLATDPLDLQTFVDEDRQGDTNAFTGERTTTFYTSFDTVRRVVQRSTTAESAQSAIEAACREDVSESSRRFAELFVRALSPPPKPLAKGQRPPSKAPPPQSPVDESNAQSRTSWWLADGARAASKNSRASLAVQKQEVTRIDAEMTALVRSPSRGLLEVGAYKARCSPGSSWRRLGRGDGFSLGAGSEARSQSVNDALAELRSELYVANEITFAVISPLPLEESVELVANEFARLPRSPSRGKAPPPRAADPAAAVSTPYMELAAEYPDARERLMTPMALQRQARGRATVRLAWDVTFADVVDEARKKPLDLLGRALTAPHPRSLAAALRARGLSPLQVETEPIVQCKNVARADGWAVWQLEIVLANGAESRWREAAGLAALAVSRLAERGVPDHVVREVQKLSDAAWRYSSRPPSALELANDLQVEDNPELAVRAARTFVGDPSTLSAAASAVAKQLVARAPIVTVWTDDVAPLGVTGDPGPPLPTPLGNAGTLIPLRAAPDGGVLTTESWARVYAGTLRPSELQPPPPNEWVPSSFASGSEIASPMAKLGYRFASDGVRGVGDGRVGSGLGTLQLPGCVNKRTLASIRGSRAAIADSACMAQPDGFSPPRPLATAALQINSPIPSTASIRQAARAEMWRLSLLQEIAELTSLAAYGGLKCDVSFNTRGMRLIVSGYAQRLPKFMARLVRRTLRHEAQPASSPALAAVRRSAIAAANAGQGISPPGKLDELRRATPKQMQGEINRLFGSVYGAQLLLAGALSRDAAEALNSVVRRELEPLLPSAVDYTKPYAVDYTKSADYSVDEELSTWGGLLYKSRYTSNYAVNVCLDPAIARVLDQCGGL